METAGTLPLPEPVPGEQPGLCPDPAEGRIYATSRRVRGTDVAPDGRLRLDALARYLQDAAEDDVTDSGWREPCGWLLRRCVITIRGFPRAGELVAVRTFCSAIGPRWAGRTTTVAGDAGSLLQARAVWAATDLASGRPVSLGPEFRRIYGPSAAGRTVSARLPLPGPPDRLAEGTPWPLRATDFDTAGHVNNSVHWAAAEEALAGAGWLPARAEVDYRRQIRPGARPRLAVLPEPAGLLLWLREGTEVLAAARLTRAATGPGARGGDRKTVLSAESATRRARAGRPE
jgi:acyl-ACP thioesterase